MWSGRGLIARCFGALLLMQVAVVFGVKLTVEQITDFDFTSEQLAATIKEEKKQMQKLKATYGARTYGFSRKGHPEPKTDVPKLAEQANPPPINQPTGSPADLPPSKTRITNYEEQQTGNIVRHTIIVQGNPYQRGVGALRQVKTNGELGVWKRTTFPKSSTEKMSTTLRQFSFDIPIEYHEDPHWFTILIDGGVLRFRTFWGNKKISPENHMQGMLMYLKEKMKLVDPDEERNMTVTQHIDDLYEKIQLLGKTDGQHMELIKSLQGVVKRVEDKFDKAIGEKASNADLEALRQELTTNLVSLESQIDAKFETVNANIEQNKREFEKKIADAIAFAKEERAKLEAAIQQVKTESVKNKERLDALTTRVNSLDGKIAKLENLEQTVKNNYNELKEKIDKNTNLIGVKEAENLRIFDEIKKDIAALALKHANDMTALESELEKMETDNNAELEKAKNELDKKILEATNLANDINATLSKKIEEMEQNSGSLQSSLDSLLADVNELKESTAALQELNETAHGHRSKLEDRIEADENMLKNFMIESKSQFEDVYAKITADVLELKAVEKNLTDKIDDNEVQVESEMDKIKMRLEAVEDEASKIGELEASTKAKFKELEGDVTKVEDEVAAMKTDYEKRLKDMKTTIDSHTSKIEALEGEVSGMKTNYDQQFKEVNSAITSQTGELDTVKEEVKGLKEDYKKKFEEIDSKVANLNSTIEAVDATVSTMKTTYDTKFTSTEIEIKELTGRMEAVEKNTVFDWDGKLYYPDLNPKGEL